MTAVPKPTPTVKTKRRPTDADRAEYNYVRARDNGCVGFRLLPAGGCKGRIEVDHVRASGGLGMKSPTVRQNMVSLCSWHHRLKTENGKVWRPLLLAYLERVER